MEQQNKDPAKEYQSRENRKARFLRNSTKDAFFLETHFGAYLIPNIFCSFKDSELQEIYTTFERDDERFMARVISLNKFGVGFSYYVHEGFIYDRNPDIEKMAFGVEFLNPKIFIENFNKTLNNFTIKIP